MGFGGLLFFIGLAIGLLIRLSVRQRLLGLAVFTRQLHRARWWLLGAAIVFLLTVPRLVVSLRFPEPHVEHRDGAGTLVVAMHGMSGAPSREGLLEIAHAAYPEADVLAPRYPSEPLSNVDPYDLADSVEQTIDSAYREHQYRKIVLIGHSMGAMLLRKVLVWAHGFEEDRYGQKGRREWVRRVDRFVSLAGINRGWSIDPAPEHLRWPKYLAIYLGEKVGRLIGIGKLVLSLQRGAPFVADLRVQWIRAARMGKKRCELPPVIHLLGNIDDIVSRQDSRDIAVSPCVTFVTLPNVGHAEIAEALRKGYDHDRSLRRHVHEALTLPPNQIAADVASPLVEDRHVTRLVYIMHGIRDWASWGDDLRGKVESELRESERATVGIVPAKYGYFPMAPFLLAWDRQKNVRWFMDQFTDDIARFPNVKVVDYLGHSNGTYILASALQRYRTLNVRNVYFAGSVVPTYYPWKELLDAGRVEKVTNAVATSDWVVALFPKFFEQVAVWSGRPRVSGFFDIGAAGFRAAQEANGRVENIVFVAGGHGAGIDLREPDRLQAIVDYIKTGQPDRLLSLKDDDEQPSWLGHLSDMSWLVWAVLAGVVVAVGFAVHRLGAFTIRIGATSVHGRTVLLVSYILLIIALLNSV